MNFWRRGKVTLKIGKLVNHLDYLSCCEEQTSVNNVKQIDWDILNKKYEIERLMKEQDEGEIDDSTAL